MKSRARNGKYVFEYDVGLSTFGSVQVYKDIEAGVLRSCKIVPKNHLRNPAEAMSRLKQLETLQHPHVARIVEVIEEAASIFIVSEFCVGGPVDDWVADMQQLEANAVVDEGTCCGYIRQALQALVHCEQKGVMHGDLRPSGLLLSSKQPDAVVKVGDFGLASILDPDRSFVRRHAGPFTAPEVLEGSVPANSIAPDLWSIGAIAHTLLVGHPPGGRPADGGSVLAGLFSVRGDEWTERSTMSRDFVQQLLKPARERPTALKALQHPWLKAGQLPSGPSAAVQDASSKTLCYMLAVMLVPPLLPVGDFENLRHGFAQADMDADGLIPQQTAQRLLLGRSIMKESAQASIEIADVDGTGVLDLCATTVADVLGREFMPNGPVEANELSQRLMKRFFEIYSDCYGNSQRTIVTCGQIHTRLRTPTWREVERNCGVHYEQILANFPVDCPLTPQILAASFIDSGGQGTPLAGSYRGQDPDELTLFIFSLDGIEHVVGGIFKACGFMRPGRRIEGAECM